MEQSNLEHKKKRKKPAPLPLKLTSSSRVKVVQASNHSATKAFPSSHNPDQYSAYQHQKSFGSFINFLVPEKKLFKEPVLITTSGSSNH